VLSVANSYAAEGFATIGIDIPFHGDRYPTSRDDFHNFTAAVGPDGLADRVTLSQMWFFDVAGQPSEGIGSVDPQAISANFRQAALDMIAEIRLLKAGDWSALDTAEPALAELAFRADRIVYTGESFGSIIGALALPFADVGAAALSVGGGGLVFPLLENSPTYWPIFGTLVAGTFGISPSEIDPLYDPAHTQFAFLLTQSALESGDPLPYARHVIREPLAGAPRHVLSLSAYSDESVPNQCNEALAAAFGLEWVEVGGSSSGTRYVEPLGQKTAPVSGNVQVGDAAVTAAFVQVTPAGHGMLTNQHSEQNYDVGFPPFMPHEPAVPIDNPIVEIQALVVGFAAGWAGGGTPEVLDTFGP
jgi:hypothetical protein